MAGSIVITRSSFRSSKLPIPLLIPPLGGGISLSAPSRLSPFAVRSNAQGGLEEEGEGIFLLCYASSCYAAAA